MVPHLTFQRDNRTNMKAQDAIRARKSFEGHRLLNKGSAAYVVDTKHTV